MLVSGIDMGICEYSIAWRSRVHLLNHTIQPRYTESKIVAIFVLWVLCTDLEEGKFVWSQVRMKELKSSWEKWVSGPVDIL